MSASACLLVLHSYIFLKKKVMLLLWIVFGSVLSLCLMWDENIMQPLAKVYLFVAFVLQMLWQPKDELCINLPS
jgi:hypothetical protein